MASFFSNETFAFDSMIIRRTDGREEIAEENNICHNVNEAGDVFGSYGRGERSEIKSSAIVFAASFKSFNVNAMSHPRPWFESINLQLTAW